MANNPHVNKVQLADGTTVMDITPTTATASDVLSGKYFFTANGTLTSGTNSGGSGDGYVWQDANGYVHLSDEEGTQPIYDTLNVNASGTFTPAQGHAFNSVVVPSGTSGTPTASKGTVSNHSISVTPSVTNSAGYITGSTKVGTAVSVSASELVSGTYNVNSSGTKDVTNYESASVPAGTVTAPSSISGTSATVSTGTNTLTLCKTVSVTPSVTTAGYVSSGTSGNSSVSLTASVNTRSSSDLSASGATVTAPAGYYGSSASKSVASGTATPASSISGTSATVSTGTNTLTLSKTISNTPTVSAGYISSGTAGNSSVSLTANVTTKGAATITPTTTNQTIASGTYITGTQTISGDANLVAGNIKDGTTIFGVTGSYSGGGGSNVIGGMFTTSSGGSAETITIPYTGDGFIMQLAISIDEGTYNSSGTVYETIHQYGIVYAVFCKINNTTPTYLYDDSNSVSRYIAYKSSGSQSNTLGANSSNTEMYVFSPYSASSASWSSVLQINSSTALSFYVSSASGTRGLLPNTTYRYSIVYSS